MSKKTESKEVVNWQDELAGFAKESSEAVKPEASNIGLRAGIVTYAGTPVPDNKLQLIILGFINEHTFYEGAYDPDNITSPSCFALGADKDAMEPHDKVATPVSSACETCPNLKWGSSPKGKGKACQERYRLMAVPVDAASSPEAMLAAEVAIIKLPVTSGKIWNQYINNISGLFKRPEWGMITELSAQPDPKTQFKAIFTPVSGVDFDEQPELYGAIRQKIELSQPILLKPYDAPSEPEAAPEGKFNA